MTDSLPSVPTFRLAPRDVARRSFGTTRRGFDPDEVRGFLEEIANALEQAEQRERELLDRVREAEERARHPAIDEAVLTSALGQRSAAVLRGAHEEAARILSQAEDAAAAMVREAQHQATEAQQQATEAQVNAESAAAQRIAEAELEANALLQQARDEAASILDAAHGEGEELIERAREHGRAMLDQAQEARRRVLADLARRRRLVTEQIEQFRAARDQVAGSVVGVRRSLDRIVEDLANADEAARAAAAAAARPPAPEAPEPVLVEEGERAAEEVGLGAGSEYTAVQGATEDPRPERAPAPSARAGGRPMLRFDDVATVVSPPPPGYEPVTLSAEEPPPPPAAEKTAEGHVATVEIHDWASDPPAPESAKAPGAPDALQATGGEDPGRPAGHSNGGSGVEGLFARLRARQLADGVPAASTRGQLRAGAAPPDVVEGGHVPDPVDRPVAAEDPVGARATPARAKESPEASAPAGGVSKSEPVADDAGSVPLPVPGQEEEPPERAALARRAAVLDPLVTSMARRLKRALQDDQNRLLDRLRQGTGGWADELLVDEASQRALYEKAAAGAVRDSVAGGIAFGREISGARGPKVPTVDQRTVDAVCSELATTVVTLLRRRLEGGEIPDAAERIGAAYREWRGERIERLAEDSAIAAYGDGVLAGLGARGNVRWVRGDAGTGCADCEDNALADATAPGEAFPTGHLRPPAHPGCRCLVVPDPSVS